MNYMTMVCDIKKSHQLENREAVQYQIIDMLKEANGRFSDSIVAPFIITLGDEWQGLLKNRPNYSEILSFFHQKLGKIDFYCGIGVGEVTINNFELTVNQLDGPSFHKARKAINLAKEQNYSLVLLH